MLRTSGRRITPRAAAALAALQEGVAIYLDRHQSGDWGEDADDRASSDHALRFGHQILSNYRLPDGANLFIIPAVHRTTRPSPPISVKAALRLSLPALALAAAAFAADRPNLVILYAVDMGYGDLAIQNPDSRIRTPHLDQLAREQPGIFDTTDIQRGAPSNWYRVKDEAAYTQGIVRTINAKGICAHWDGEELNLKRSNVSSENYDILTSQGYVRRGEGAYQVDCFPAYF